MSVTCDSPVLVSDRISGYAVGFATLVMIITLGVGWVTQFFSGHLAKYLRGRMGLVGGSLITVGALLLIPAAYAHQVWIVLVAAPVFGAGYGLAMVSGLAATQALATPKDLAGITAVFDPDFPARRISAELPNVTIEDALDNDGRQ